MLKIDENEYLSTARVVRSLLADKDGNDPKHTAAVENSKHGLELPVNSDLTLFADFLRISEKACGHFSHTPYWMNDGCYHPLEVFTVTIEFLDFHKEPLPTTCLPPEEDVWKFVDYMNNSPYKMTLQDQYTILLDLAKGNIVGAANLGFIGTRILARGRDSRAYPNVPMTADIIANASKHFAQFDSDFLPNDAPGDTYYFWTHVFAALAYRQLNGINPKLLEKLYSIGTPLMVWVRKNIAGKITIGEHYVASELGRNIGIGLYETMMENNS